jgi:hypothetical protein
VAQTTSATTVAAPALSEEQAMYSSRQIALLNVDETTIVETKYVCARCSLPATSAHLNYTTFVLFGTE